MPVFDELVSDVLNGIEDCMDRYEDRMLVGGPEWETDCKHKYTVYIDGEKFVVTIEKRSE